MNKVILLAVLLSLNAHAYSRKARAPEPSPIPAPSCVGSHSCLPQPTIPSPSPLNTNLPSWTPSLGGLHFAPILNATIAEVTRVKLADERVNALVASKCFENFFLKQPLIQTNGMTRAQVVAYIRKAVKTVPVSYYYEDSGTVGYVQPPDTTIHVNRAFHDGYSVAAEASGNGHEMMHALGFEHDYYRTRRRWQSVPYSWNKMAETCP